MKKLNDSNMFIDRGIICPICKSKNSRIIIKNGQYNDKALNFIKQYYKVDINSDIFKFEIWKCDECTFSWQRYCLGVPYSVDLYTTWIDNEDSIRKKTAIEKINDLKYNYTKQMNRMLLMFNGCKNLSIVDWGMGLGHWCKFMIDNGFKNIQGYDFDNKCDYATKTFGVKKYNMEYSVTFINMEQVLEHIPDINTLMFNIKKCLEKDGVLRIATPDAIFLEQNIEDGEIDKLMSSIIQPLEHVNIWNRLSIEKLLNKNGFGYIYFVKDSNTNVYTSEQPMKILDDKINEFRDRSKQVQVIIHHRRKSWKEPKVKILKVRKYDKYQKLGAYHWDLYRTETLYREHIDFILSQFKNIDCKGKSIIDVGCGDGLLANKLHQLGFTVFGVDSDKYAIKLAREKCKGLNIQFSCKSCYDIRDIYDFAVCSEVIEHVVDGKELVNILYSHIHQFSIITTPNGRNTRWGKFDLQKWTTQTFSYMLKNCKYRFEFIKKTRKKLYVKLMCNDYGKKK